jgi:hypothetical protein
MIDKNSWLLTKGHITRSCKENISDKPALAWFEDQLAQLHTSKDFYLAFGRVNNRIQKLPISVSHKTRALIQAIEPCFNPESWRLDQLCRLALLLSLPEEQNLEIITSLIATADIQEQVVIFRSLIFLQNSKCFTMTAIDGIRTNVVNVFDAIAMHNSFAYEYFNQDAWNQMVLKAFFMGRPVFKIRGLDNRKNQKLATMLYNFSKERRSANRPISPELWRLMDSFIDDGIVVDLKGTVENNQLENRLTAIKELGSNNSKGSN